ncbi:MAG: enoyl-CoA hydratase/isomerase family protein [Bradyrhizobiaceae bacterium]|nr:enoyl-CoA hydratase/isomerase family protein [Bradyrhizobiaceae bacterium]
MTAINSVTDLTCEGDIAVVTLNSPPVNALSADVRNGLFRGANEALADPTINALVLICAGRTFIAGADISEFSKPPTGRSMKEIENALEGGSKPVIAAMHGTTLGGGFEVALMCHYRVAVPSAKFGFPEIKLGLIPGAGGTQRLPRLVGVERALDLILSGAPFGASEARRDGIIDDIVEESRLREGAIAFARKVIDTAMPLRKIRDMNAMIEAARGKEEIFDKVRRDNARRFRGFHSFEAAISAVKAAVDLPFEDGMKFELETFRRLVPTPQARAQRYVFFAERQVAKIEDIPDDTPILPIRKVGVIGAGTMGGGISMNFLNAGLPVTIVESNREALDRGLAVIRRNYDNTAKKGRLTADDVNKRMALLDPGLDLEALGDCDLVIEAVYEDMEIKKEVFGRLDRVAKSGAILASNTSFLNIDEIASVTARPDHVLGMHFFSPANVMRLLEVVRGRQTAKSVVATALKLSKAIGKIGVPVGVCHGFVGNRMLEKRQYEANLLMLEGAMPWDIDRVLYDFGLPMGPFAMADLAGLDIGWSKDKSRSASIRDVLCEMDRRGQKTGAGFYDYDDQRRARPSPVVEQIILDFANRTGVNRRAIPDEEILERCVFPMINEGAKILEEGIAQRASDIDIVWINGYGWPPYRGGPMFYADLVGLDRVVAALKRYEATLGDRFKPAPMLEKRVAEGKGITRGA